VEKKHKLFVNKIKILTLLLEHGKPVEWRKKVIGYGLKGSDFGQISQKSTTVSRDIFNDYKRELLSRRYITQLKTSDRRSSHYTITPFGIAYLMNDYEIKPTNLRRVFEILLFFYDNQLIKNGFLKKNKIENDFTMKILDIYKKKNISQILNSTMKDCIKVHENSIIDSTILLNFSSIELILASIVIGEGFVNWFETNDESMLKDFKFTLNDKQFFSYFSLYLLVVFFYNIFELQYVLAVKLINKSQKLQEIELDDTVKTMKKTVTSLLQHSEKQITNDMNFYLKKVYQNINSSSKV